VYPSADPDRFLLYPPALGAPLISIQNLFVREIDRFQIEREGSGELVSHGEEVKWLLHFKLPGHIELSFELGYLKVQIKWLPDLDAIEQSKKPSIIVLNTVATYRMSRYDTLMMNETRYQITKSTKAEPGRREIGRYDKKTGRRE
jgi:hypothetical protein